MRARKGMTLDARFWMRACRVPNGCWEYDGYRNEHGYGQFAVNTSWGVLAHRVAWVLTFGPIPVGLEVCHTCDNPPCINPAHLFIGTHGDNVQDMWTKGRHPRPTSFRRLTDDQVFAIHELRGHLTPRQIGERFGVTTRHVYRIFAAAIAHRAQKQRELAREAAGRYDGLPEDAA
jgi:hypothetical protein